MAKDNGGAIAQRGFNFQNCVISLVAIRNYTKKNFSIYVEADDDFEVTYDDNYHAYIQVKGEKKMSLNKLMKRTSKAPSIFDKHFSNGTEDSKYKIVVYNFLESDLNQMQEQMAEEELFSKSWLLSDNQKNQICNERSNNFSLVKTDFDNDIATARTYLKGELLNQKIAVENKDDLILDELFRQIIQKSEKNVQTKEDKELKKITSEELNLILQKLTSKARFEKELEKFGLTSFRIEKIKKEEKKIILEYMAVKKAILEYFKTNENKLEEELVTKVVKDTFNLPAMQDLSENSRYAVALSAYCDILEGIANE